MPHRPHLPDLWAGYGEPMWSSMHAERRLPQQRSLQVVSPRTLLRGPWHRWERRRLRGRGRLRRSARLCSLAGRNMRPSGVHAERRLRDGHLLHSRHDPRVQRVRTVVLDE